jgi:hypothetical protein
MEGLRQEILAIFGTLAEELKQQLSAQADTEPADSEAGGLRAHRPLPPNPKLAAGDWESLGDELPSRPGPPDESLPKLFKLAKELKRRAAMITAGRDLHDIHTILHMASAWEQLPEAAKGYAAHRMRLLYIAITKEWPAALYYGQQGEDEFLDLAPDFWLQYQPRPFTAPQTQQRAPRTATRKGKGKQQQGTK